MTAVAIIVLMSCAPIAAESGEAPKVPELPSEFVVPDFVARQVSEPIDVGSYGCLVEFSKRRFEQGRETVEMNVYPGFHPALRTQLANAVHGIGGIWYPPLPVGSVVPVFGGVYRVDGPRDLPFSSKRGMRFVRVEAKGPLAGAVVAPDALAVPVRGKSEIGFQPFEVVDIVRADPERKVVLHAKLRLDTSASSTLKQRREDIDMTPGDLLQTATGTFLLRRIVPPDPKAQIVGWVEFDLIHRDPKEGERVR